jgi:hypothetical protein
MNSPFLTITLAKHNSRPKPVDCFQHMDGADKPPAATTRPTVMAATAPTSSRRRPVAITTNDMSVTGTNKTLQSHKNHNKMAATATTICRQFTSRLAYFTIRARSPIHCSQPNPLARSPLNRRRVRKVHTRLATQSTTRSPLNHSTVGLAAQSTAGLAAQSTAGFTAF